MKNINHIFDQLSAVSSRLEKEAILTRYQLLADLKTAVFLALDPNTQFYQRKIPEYTPRSGHSDMDLSSAMSALGDLSDRKVTGHAAIEYLTKLLESLTESDAKVIERIIKKDLNCGVQASTANKIWKGLVSEYPCMLASTFDIKLVDGIQFPTIAQMKMDGMRFNAIVCGDSVEYRSRNGKYILINNVVLDAAFIKMAKNVDIGNVVFDGELLVVDSAGKPLDRKTGNGILNKAVKGTISDDEVSGIRAVVWDIIPVKSFWAGKCDVDYQTRLATVVTAFEHLGNLSHMVSVVETVIVNDVRETQNMFQTYFEAGHEGIILKDLRGVWEDKRAKHQIKFKGELDCDLKIVNVEPHRKNNKMIGAIVCESSDGIVKVSVGSGLTKAQRENLVSSDLIGKIVTIKYNARITNKQGGDSLFLPIFLEIREDKSEADSSDRIK